MDHEEVVNQLVELLQKHKDGSRGSAHQEPYKGDLFCLFAAAFNAGLIGSPGRAGVLSADGLIDVIGGRRPELLDQEAWYILHRFWTDWTYAWQNTNLLER